MRTSVSLSTWRLDPDWDPLRRPPRDAALRNPGYEDEYDFLTVFFDVFWDERGDTIVALGPPLFNLEAELQLRFRALPSGELCAFHTDRRVLVDRVTVRPPPGTTGLVAESSAGHVHLTPQPNLSRDFSGARALFTLNKDNDLAWVRDWALFYARNHGCDAVLVYDNGSARYGPADLAETLATVPGIGRSLVLDWRFPYGVFDLRRSPAINRIDSIYCQWGCFEHARLRLFRDAAAVSNADVDELVVSDTGRTVFEAAEDSPTGHVAYRGFWIGCPPGDLTGEIARAPRHRHFWKTTAEREGCQTKWTAAPRRTPADVQWGVHELHGFHHTLSTESSTMNPHWGDWCDRAKLSADIR